MFQKELILIKQVHQKSLIFVIISILKILVIKFQPYVCNGCHDISKIAYELKKHCNTKCKMR